MESLKRSVSYSQPNICTSQGRNKSDTTPLGSAGFCVAGRSKPPPGPSAITCFSLAWWVKEAEWGGKDGAASPA